MSADVRRVATELVENRYTLEMKHSMGRCAGFVFKALLGDDGDYTRGSQIVIVKQPGARHPITATEQYVTTHGGRVYLDGQPRPIDLTQAAELAPVPQGAPDTDIVAIYIGAELLLRSKQSSAE